MTGLKALTYFQVGTIIAMTTGLVAINVFRLGDGVHADPATIEVGESAQKYIQTGETRQWWEFLTHIVPESFFAPFVEGDILQVIFLAVIFGIAIKLVGKVGEPVVAGAKRLTEVVFKVLAIVMKAAPLGAFGAMAYAIGKFGLSTLTSLGSLIALFYVTSIVFVVVVLGGVLAAYVRLNIFQLFRYLKDEFYLVLGTSTAEPALPGLMRKLNLPGRRPRHRRPGCAHRLQLQPRRRGHLPVAGHALHRPGHRHPAHRDPAVGAARGHAADLQGRGRRGRWRVHRPHRDPVHGRDRARRRSSC